MEDLIMNETQMEDLSVKTWQSLGLGILIGITAGALVGLLYAPKKGKYLRADISRRAGELIDDATGIVRETVDVATRGVQSITKNFGTA